MDAVESRSKRGITLPAPSSAIFLRGGRTWTALLLVATAAPHAAATFTGSTRIVDYGFPSNTDFFLPLAAVRAPETSILAIAGKNGAVDFLDLAQPVGGANPRRVLQIPIDREVLFDDVPGLLTLNDSGLHGVAFHPDFAQNGKFYVNATMDNSVVAGSPFLNLTGQPLDEGGTFNPADGFSAAEAAHVNAYLRGQWDSSPQHGLVSQLFWCEPGYDVQPPQAILNGSQLSVRCFPGTSTDVNLSKPVAYLHGAAVEVREYVAPAGGGAVDPNDFRLVLRYQANFEYHNGGWMEFGPDENLYVATGDSVGNPINGMTYSESVTADWHGKILRIDVNGGDAYPTDSSRNYAIPSDNPFASNSNVLAQAVWAYGLRHPWRNSFDAVTGDLWIGDVGFGSPNGPPNSIGVEEVNVAPSGTGGLNFGWPYFEGDLPLNVSGAHGTPPIGATFTTPTFSYQHTSQSRAAIIGGLVYRGSDPELQGKYLYFDSNRRELWMLDPADPAGTLQNISALVFSNPGPTPTWTPTNASPASVGLVASFGQDERGNVYLVDIAQNKVFRLNTAGDFNFDGKYDRFDVDLLANAARVAAPGTEQLRIFDLDGDGAIEFGVSAPGTVATDSDYLVRSILRTEYGDANLDGAVNLLDLDLVGQGFGGLGPGWLFGDFDGSGGPANLLDFDILGQFYPSSAVPADAAVPEPCWSGLAWGALGLALRRRPISPRG